MRQEVRAEKLHPPIGHYIDAVRFGELLFMSGCGPTNERLELVGGDDAAAQARQVFTNMSAVLETVGCGFHDIVKTTTYLTDIDDRSRIDPVRREFFGGSRSANASIAVSALAVPEAKVEVEAVAGIPQDR